MIRELKILFIVLILSMSTLSGQDSEVEHKSLVDTTDLKLGEQTIFQISIKSQTETKVDWPKFNDSKIGQFEIIEKFKKDTLFEDNFKTVTQGFKIASFDTGYLPIPGYQFRYINKNGKSQKFRTDPILLQVHSMKIDTAAGPKPIKPIMAVDKTWRDYIYWIAALVFILLLILIGWLIYKKYYLKSKDVKIAEIIIPPPKKALDSLKELEKEKLWQQGKVKLFHSRLTDIVREYLEGKFEVPALESTSDEIMEALESSKIDNTLKQKLNKMLQMADLVKFAKASPGFEENTQSLKDAYVFVQHTKNVGDENITDNMKIKTEEKIDH